MLEFDYEIQYKQGKTNVVAADLSRVDGAKILHMAMTVIERDLLKQIQEGYEKDVVVKGIIEELKKKTRSKQHYSWYQEILHRKNKIVVPSQANLRLMILQWLHGSNLAGHSGRDVTVQRVKSFFYWKGVAKDIHAFLRACTTCQQCKYDTSASHGLLQPLPIPEGVWMDLLMDFIDG